MYHILVTYNGVVRGYDVWADNLAQAFERAKAAHTQATGLPIDSMVISKF